MLMQFRRKEGDRERRRERGKEREREIRANIYINP